MKLTILKRKPETGREIRQERHCNAAKEKSL